MNKTTVVAESNKITIIGKKAGIASRTFLWFLAISCFLIPLMVTVNKIVSGSGFHFAMLILFLIFWGMSAWMIRIVLWNTYGKEILQLHEDTIEYIADFKFFKDGNKIFNMEETEFIHKELKTRYNKR